MTHQAQSRRHRSAARRRAAVAAAGAGSAPSLPAAAQSPAEIEYAIWGDPAELASQIALVDAFRPRTRTSRSRSSVSDWEPTGTSSRPASPVATRPTCSPWTARSTPTTSRGTCCSTCSPYIERDGFDLTALADAGVAHFTTPEGQFGLPRDLNVVGLYYNKAMFDAAGIPYPDDTWTWDTLVEVGKQLTLDKDGDGQTDQWGFYTETTDMENYWSSLVWQNGGDIVSADRTQTLLGSDEAVGGIQQLQDLIYTHKIMPPPDSCSRSSATRSSRARRPWSRTARGWCRRTSPRASTWASRRCRPVRPARPRASTPRASSWPSPPRHPTPPGSS